MRASAAPPENPRSTSRSATPRSARDQAMTNDQLSGPHLRRVAAQPQHRAARPRPHRHLDPARLRGRAAARRRGLAQNAPLCGPARAAGRRGEPDPDRRDPARPARRAAAALVARHHRLVTPATAPRSCCGTPASCSSPEPWRRPNCCQPKTATGAGTGWSATATPASSPRRCGSSRPPPGWPSPARWTAGSRTGAPGWPPSATCPRCGG